MKFSRRSGLLALLAAPLLKVLPGPDLAPHAPTYTELDGFYTRFASEMTKHPRPRLYKKKTMLALLGEHKTPYYGSGYRYHG